MSHSTAEIIVLSMFMMFFVGWGLSLLSSQDQLLDNPIIPATLLRQYSMNDKYYYGLFQLNPEEYFSQKQENITYSNCLCDCNLGCGEYINKTNYFSVSIDSNYSIKCISFNNKASRGGMIMTAYAKNSHILGGAIVGIGIILMIFLIVHSLYLLQSQRCKDSNVEIKC